MNDTRDKFCFAINLGWASVRTIGEKTEGCKPLKIKSEEKMYVYFSSSSSYLLMFVFCIPQILVPLLPQMPGGFAGLSLTHSHCKTALNPVLQELLLLLSQVRTLLDWVFAFPAAAWPGHESLLRPESQAQPQVFSKKGTFVESSLRTLPLLQCWAWMCHHFWSRNKFLVAFTLRSFLCVIFQRQGYTMVFFSPCSSLRELLASLSRMALEQMLNLIALPRLKDRNGLRHSWRGMNWGRCLMLFLRCKPTKCFPRKIIHNCFLLYIYHDREREDKRRK